MMDGEDNDFDVGGLVGKGSKQDILISEEGQQTREKWNTANRLVFNMRERKKNWPFLTELSSSSSSEYLEGGAMERNTDTQDSQR